MSIHVDHTLAGWDHSIRIRDREIPFVHPSVAALAARASGAAAATGNPVVRAARSIARWWRGAGGGDVDADPHAAARRDAKLVVPEEFHPEIDALSAYDLARLWQVWQGVAAAWAVAVQTEAVALAGAELLRGGSAAPGKTANPAANGAPVVHPASVDAGRRRMVVPLRFRDPLPSFLDPRGRPFGDPPAVGSELAGKEGADGR